MCAREGDHPRTRTDSAHSAGLSDHQGKIRAAYRLGELSRELEKAKHEGPGAVVPSGGKYKKDVLKAAGISTSAAARYEALTEIPKQEVLAVVVDLLGQCLVDACRFARRPHRCWFLIIVIQNKQHTTALQIWSPGAAASRSAVAAAGDRDGPELGARPWPPTQV